MKKGNTFSSFMEGSSLPLILPSVGDSRRFWSLSHWNSSWRASARSIRNQPAVPGRAAPSTPRAPRRGRVRRAIRPAEEPTCKRPVRVDSLLASGICRPVSHGLLIRRCVPSCCQPRPRSHPIFVVSSTHPVRREDSQISATRLCWSIGIGGSAMTP